MVKGSVELDLVNVGDFFSSHCLGKQLHIVGLITFCALKHPFSFVAILTTFLFFSSDMYTVPLPVFLLGHIQTKVLQNLEQKQEAFKWKILEKHLFGVSTGKTLGAGFLQAASPKGAGLDWISSLSFPARVQKCLLLNTGSHPSKNILSAIRFAALMSFQDFYQKPEEF